MSNLYRGPAIDAFYQISAHLAKQLQRRRLKCEKLTDDRWRKPSDGKSSRCLWQGELKRTSNHLQNITNKTTDRVTWTQLKISSSCSTSGTRCVTLATNPVISHEWGKDRKVLATSGTYPWSFVTQMFRNGQTSRGGNRITFEVMTSI